VPALVETTVNLAITQKMD